MFHFTIENKQKGGRKGPTFLDKKFLVAKTGEENRKQSTSNLGSEKYDQIGRNFATLG